jgi:hypothetical protein
MKSIIEDFLRFNYLIEPQKIIFTFRRSFCLDARQMCIGTFERAGELEACLPKLSLARCRRAKKSRLHTANLSR